MNNYIIFKGIDSKLINGLVISELPPITKPKLRVQETEIDGVDGSIIEELGYEAYDKALKIGLKPNTNIDEVIEYFNGEGNIVFSNEPDKFYKVKIIDKIDYTRLLRFKTASIKFRTQPFKYLYGETYQKFANPTGPLIAINEGTMQSKPIIKIVGSGTVEFKLEGVTIFSYTFPAGETEVVIDSEKQDAYWGSVLKNRNMIGEFPIFKKGKNSITVTGAVTELNVIANSRWL
jgi:predicted phage tail component-like protein